MMKVTDNIIDKLEIFKGIDENTRELLKSNGRIKSYEKKENIFFEREEVKSIHILLDGMVSIFKINDNGKKKIMFILKDGLVNEAMINSNLNVVSCEAFEKCTLLEYENKDFIEIMLNDKNLTKNMLISYEERNKRLYRQLKNSISIKVEKKLAAKLYRISREFSVQEEEWSYINIPITITYIADMLGCTRETVSRAMRGLEREELVKFENDKLYIKPKELSAYFKK